MIGRRLGHYRIIVGIGAGGMGEVYRAHDEQLDRDVALKVLPAGMLTDEAARKQFRKEALALAKLNHPNIETVFEFSSQDGLDFLAMELIPGHALSKKLKEGPLPQPEIIRLAKQFAEGLAAAHEQGVVHRDLKPGNLMITPDGRLKILDFGLAKLLHPTQDVDVTQSITAGTGAVSGTVPYMAPEQLRGEATDARSDIYSAGAVLYEMATGQRLFPQTQGPQLMGAILHETPPPPSSLNRRVAPALESILLKALDKEATRRYQSARELLVALESLGAGRAEPVSRAHWLIVAPASAALVVILLGGLVLGLNVGGLRDRLVRRGTLRTENGDVSSAPIKARRSVAVLGFKNLSGKPEEAWLSTALSEMLATELAAGEHLRTIPGENVAQMKINLSLADADSYGKETLSKIRLNLNTDDVVLGSYIPLGKNQVRLDLRLQDASTGETLAAISEKGDETQIDDLVSRAGTVLREKLGVAKISEAEALTVKASLPSNPEAARFYSEGLVKLRSFDNLAARDLLQKAVTTEPNFALSHAALATAWSGLGYAAKAKEEGKKAFDLSKGLGREDRLWVEGQYREAANEWDKAVGIYRTLFQSFPDNLDYGLSMASAQTSAGKGQDALATVEALRKLPAPGEGDPRIDIAEAAAADSLGDFKREQAAAAKAAEKGKAQGARLLVAKASSKLCWAFQRLGQLNHATGFCEEAKRLYAAEGDRHGVARALNAMGGVLYEQGNYAEAKTKFEECLAIEREIGSKLDIAVALSNISVIFQRQGDLTQAKRNLEEALAIEHEVGNKEDTAMMLGNLGLMLIFQGDLLGARARWEEALAIDREIGNKNQMAIWLWDLGELRYFQGDLSDAKNMLDQAQPIIQETGNKTVYAGVLVVWGQILTAQGELAGARIKYEEELSIRKAMGAKLTDSQLQLADLSVDEGHPADAEAPCRRAIEEYRVDKNADGEILARAVLARALLATVKSTDAQKEIDGAVTLVAKSQDRDLGLTFAIVAARVRAAVGKPTEATRSLEASLVEATKFGFVGHQFESRLALGEIEMRSGKADAGRARLAALEKDATAKGFLLIARKAHAAASAQ